MKKEYMDKFVLLQAKLNRSPEEDTFLAALTDLNAKEKAQPFDRAAVEAAKLVVETAEDKLEVEE